MKSKFILINLIILILFACKEKESKKNQGNNFKVTAKNQIAEELVSLDLTQANRLASLPLKCMQNEYPNKTGQVLSDSLDLGSPKALHPTFYGCFDWHSSVHGHWSLVKLMKEFPELAHCDSIMKQLMENITKENIQQEIKYFERQQEYSFERMYGWAWLLKLQAELDTWEDDSAKQLAMNLQPLSDLIINRYIEFLPKLNYPIRVGTHGNSAFGMSFAYDYAKQTKNKELLKIIETTARRMYLKDKSCPLSWEPDGFDFLSPCLEEVDLMLRILPRDEFGFWIVDFMPDLKKPNFTMKVAEVSDRTDGHLVHLDGLNFSRAWVFYRIAKAYPSDYRHLKSIGDQHLVASLSSIVDGSYEGEHWLASFALYALSER